MMLKSQGIARVTNLKKISEKLIVGVLYTIRTVNGKPKTEFYSCKFIGKAIDTIKKEKITNKSTIELTQAILSVDEYEKEGKKISTPVITIFEFNKYIKEENTKFAPIDDELPF